MIWKTHTIHFLSDSKFRIPIQFQDNFNSDGNFIITFTITTQEKDHKGRRVKRWWDRVWAQRRGMTRMRRKSERKKWWWDDTESVKGETEDISYIWQFLEVGNCEVGSWSKLCRRRRLWSAGDHTALLARWSHLVITQGAALITQRRWWWSEAPSAEVALTLLSSSGPKPLLVRPFG